MDDTNGIQYSEQMKRAISRLRRRVHDLDEENLRFSDKVLYEYISDAVDELEIHDYKKGVYVANGDFLSKKDNSPVIVSPEDIAIYTLKSHILLKTGIKDVADRDNFSLRKNNLSVDTTKQSTDHAVTLKELEAQLRQMLYRKNVIRGYRIE